MVCCVCGRRPVANSKFTFCRLPSGKNDQGRRALWLLAIGRGPLWNPVTAFVCQDHFDLDKDFEKEKTDGTKRLKSCAVPSRNLGKRPRAILGDITNVVSSCSSSNSNSNTPSPCSRAPVCVSHFKVQESRPPVHITSPTSIALQDHDYRFVIPSPPEPSTPLPENSIVVDCQPPQEITSELDRVVQALAAAERENAALKAKVQSVDKLTKEVHSLRRVVKNERKAKSRLQNHMVLTQKNLSKVLSQDQFKALGRNSTRGMKWGDCIVEEALELKSQCGTSAYDFVAHKFRFPLSRTIQQRTEHIKFVSGILHETFDKLKVSSPMMADQEKDCMIALDEMALTPNGNLIDPSTKKPIGKCTLPGHSGVATKALVLMLGGITTRWKLVTAYYFSGSREGKGKPTKAQSRRFGLGMKQILLDVISEAEKIGLRVHTVTSDMGPDNRAMWNAFGVFAKKSGEVNSSVPHPCDTSRKLHFIADVPHLFKNIVQMLQKNRTIFLPSNIVAEFGLPSNEVKWSHIEELVNFESTYELKIAFRAKQANMARHSHFEKMKVGNAKAIFCNQTKVALERLAVKKNKPELRTTAWFIGMVSRWFDLSTSRCHSMALSLANPVAYGNAIDHFKKTSRVFQEMKVGKEWKPAQEGVMLCISTILQLQHYFLHDRKFKFLLTSRFTQDFLENLFSQIRRRNPLPTALLFKNVLKEIFLSGKCCKTPKGASYDHDEGHMLVSFLTQSKEASLERQLEVCEEVTPNITVHCPPILDNDIYSIVDDWELTIIYDMAGATVHSLMGIRKIPRNCSCISSILWPDSSCHHPYGSVTEGKNYTEGALIEVNDKCFVALSKCEIIFRIFRAPLLNEKSVKVVEYVCDKASYVWTEFPIPSCHKDLFKWLMHRYFTIRFRQYGLLGVEASKELTPIYGSKTIGMRETVKIL